MCWMYGCEIVWGDGCCSRRCCGESVTECCVRDLRSGTLKLMVNAFPDHNEHAHTGTHPPASKWEHIAARGRYPFKIITQRESIVEPSTRKTDKDTQIQSQPGKTIRLIIVRKHFSQQLWLSRQQRRWWGSFAIRVIQSIHIRIGSSTVCLNVCVNIHEPN